MMKWVAAAVLLFGMLDRKSKDARLATERMAATVMQQWPAGVVATTKKPGEWGYEEGVLLDGLIAEWRVSGNAAEFAYVKSAVDKYVLPDGRLQMNATGKVFTTDEHQLDNIELGRAVLAVYKQRHDERYARAAKFLHEQLDSQPRGPSGGYWHKQVYPNQMWLDGAYMAEPFRAEYAATFGTTADFDDIAKQLLLMNERMYEPHSRLLRHGWDESRKMPWADARTGQSPEVWARAMGWYCMGLVDVLDWFPQRHPMRARLVDLLHRTLVNVMQYQDLSTGLWWQVMDKGPRVTGTLDAHGQRHMQEDLPAQKGNYLESSASAMFCYAIAKSDRMDYFGLRSVKKDMRVKVPQMGTVTMHANEGVYRAEAQRAWDGLGRKFLREDASGNVVLTGTVKAAGLGGTPYRSGTYEYYVAEPVGEKDAKGVGAYLLAGSEMGR